MKKKKIVSIIVLCFMLVSFFSPLVPVYASEENNHEGTNLLHLYELKEKIKIENGLQLEKGFTFYGKEIPNTKKVKFQFLDSELEVDKSDLIELTDSSIKDVYTYKEFKETTNTITLEESMKLYMSSKEDPKVSFLNELEYMINNNNEIIIGNIAYLLTEGTNEDTENSEESEETNEATNDNDNTNNSDSENQEESGKQVIPDHENDDVETPKEIDDSDSSSSENIDVVSDNESIVEDTPKELKETTQRKSTEISTSNTQKEITQTMFSSTDRYMKVTKDVEVYLRENGELKVVGYLLEGEIYPRYEASTSWHEIQYGSGKAFVKKENTVPVEDNGELKNINNTYNVKEYENKFVASQDITIYDNSSGDLAPFGTIKKGEEYTIAHDYGGKWIYVVYADRIGYVDSSLIKLNFKSTDKYFKARNDTSVYLRKNGSLVEVAKLKSGQIYPRYEASPSWHEIQYGSGRAYVKKDETIPVSKANINNINHTYDIKNYEITSTALSDLPIYDNSSGDLVQYGTIKKGEVYTIARDYGGQWVYVVFADRVGYIKRSSIRKHFRKSDQYFKVLEDTLPIYDNRSGRLVKVGSLKKNQVYQRYKTTGQWHQIQFSNYTAYVESSKTDVATKKEISGLNDGSYRNGPETLVAINDTTVYDNSTGKLVPIGNILEGQEYTIARDYGGKWIYIIFAGRVGLVKLENVQIDFLITAPKAKLYTSYSDLSNYTQQNGKGYIYYGQSVKVLERKNYAARVQTKGGETGWVHADSLDKSLSDNWWFVKESRNLRSSSSSSSTLIGSIPSKSNVRVLDYKYDANQTYKDWYKIRTVDGKEGWIWGGSVNGRNVIQYEPQYRNSVTNNITIFTPLNSKTSYTASDINNFIASKTTKSSYMYGMGAAYIAAQKETGVNAIYLVAHSALETGYGNSSIVKNKYNYFGIGAFDACPSSCSSTFEGKTQGIINGADWISRNYINRDAYQQFTLDNMRYNNNTHQYATDEAWHVKIVQIAQEFRTFVQNN